MQAVLSVGGSTSASCEMGVKADANNWAGFDAESVPPHDLYFLYRTTAGGEDSIAIESDATTMSYMRIRHVAADGSLRWETSGDGVTWTQRRSVSAPWAVSSLKAVVLAGPYPLGLPAQGPANGTTCSSGPLLTRWERPAVCRPNRPLHPPAPEPVQLAVQLARRAHMPALSREGRAPARRSTDATKDSGRRRSGRAISEPGRSVGRESEPTSVPWRGCTALR